MDHAHHSASTPSGHGACCHAEARAAPAKDPVCGMTVDPTTAKHRAEHDGRTYYFCSAGCRSK
ncbi:MAG TPA: YHS domain-containing protein, partial [Xanthobacteraceae bacterium]|nr:YHS domain-containing protein [Xanthobacteraceae bacterium]